MLFRSGGLKDINLSLSHALRSSLFLTLSVPLFFSRSPCLSLSHPHTQEGGGGRRGAGEDIKTPSLSSLTAPLFLTHSLFLTLPLSFITHTLFLTRSPSHTVPLFLTLSLSFSPSLAGAHPSLSLFRCPSLSHSRGRTCTSGHTMSQAGAAARRRR